MTARAVRIVRPPAEAIRTPEDPPWITGVLWDEEDGLELVYELTCRP